MRAGLGHVLYVLQAILFAGLALFHVWVWVRNGFRIPRHIHLMALVAALIGWGLLEISPPDSPMRKEGLIQAASFILIFPAIVYGAYVLLGGAQPDVGE